MNIEEAVRDTFRQMSEQDMPPTPPDLADRVLRRRRRRRAGGVTALAATMAAVIAVSAWLPTLTGGHRSGPAARTTAVHDVLAHPHQSPPENLVAAGRTAMSAFTTLTKEKQPNGDVVVHHHWHLYDPSTGRYRATDWAWADVAPGLRQAAVLAGPLPQRRVGILDLASGQVTRWIGLPKPAASVYWSPDGRKLLLTTYSKNPDRIPKDQGSDAKRPKKPGEVSPRTGFEVVAVASGSLQWHAKPPLQDPKVAWYLNRPRQDLRWSWDGSRLWEHSPVLPPKHFYDLRGNKTTAPVGENHAYSEAGRSPGGRYAAGDFAGANGRVATEVLDARTGKRVATQPVQELLAWADDHRLIAWGCGGVRCGGKGEYHQHLVLVDLRGKHVRVLSGFRTRGQEGSWEPHFSRR